MQLHYSPKLMQPEGHLGALFSIYECILYIYVCVHPRGRLFAASFRRWQAFGSGPHVGLMLTHSPDHTDPKGLAMG